MTEPLAAPSATGTRSTCRVRIPSLLFGLMFLVIGLAGALSGTDAADSWQPWLWAAGFGVLGIGGLVSAIAALTSRSG